MSALPHSLQLLLRENNGWRTWRPWRNSQHRRQNNYNLRFAEDIDGLPGTRSKLISLIKYLDEAYTAYGMQINAQKTQMMTNNTNGISAGIAIDNKKLQTVHSFKYLGAVVSDEGSKPVVLSRISQTTAAVTKLKVIWNDKNIAIGSKIKLMRYLVSIFCMHVKRGPSQRTSKEVMEMRCLRKHLGISYRDHINKTTKWKRHRAIWRLPDFSEKTQTEVARARYTIISTGQDCPTGNSTRRETKRQTEKIWEDNIR